MIVVNRKLGKQVLLLSIMTLAVLAYTGPANASPTYSFQWGSAGTTDGQFQSPMGIAFDSSNNNVFVADTNNNRIQKFDSAGAWVTSWGTSGGGQGQFSGPQGVTVDSITHNVYVSDTWNSRVVKYTSTGAYVTQWAVPVTSGVQCTGGYYCFAMTNGIAVDSTATTCSGGACIYVIGASDGIVYRYSATGTYIGQFRSTNTGIGTGKGQFSTGFYSHIAVDSTHNVYVTDPGGNYRVQKFDASGNFITMWGWDVNATVAGTGFETCTQASGNTCKAGVAGSGNGQFNFPSGIAADNSGNVFVTDVNNYRVQEFTTSGAYVDKFGVNGSGSGQFTGPYDVAFSNASRLYVADTSNRIEVWDIPAPPVVTTGSGATATLNGTVNPKGSATTYKFDYGTTTAYGSSSTPTSAGSGTTAVDVSATISSLASSTLYHFRIEATNAYGTAYGSDATFRTPPDTTITPPPVVSSNGATFSFSFTSTSSPATFQCRFDGSAWASCPNPPPQPQVYSPARESAHVFYVRSTDTGTGYVDASPASWSWTATTAVQHQVTYDNGVNITSASDVFTTNGWDVNK